MTAKPTSHEALVAALGTRPDATVPDLAAATHLSRSTIGKALAKLERDGKVLRQPRGDRAREGSRIAGRWSARTQMPDRDEQ
jgi:DeoR/GlpR family transcriptional regulator of sugar metabolism